MKKWGDLRGRSIFPTTRVYNEFTFLSRFLESLYLGDNRDHLDISTLASYLSQVSFIQTNSRNTHFSQKELTPRNTAVPKFPGSCG